MTNVIFELFTTKDSGLTFEIIHTFIHYDKVRSYFPTIDESGNPSPLPLGCVMDSLLVFTLYVVLLEVTPVALDW